MFVYVSEQWNIIYRGKERINLPWCKIFECEYSIADRLIHEDNQIKLYEESKQYIEDTNRYHLQKEIDELNRKNSDLTKIANTKVTKELELDKQWVEADAYQRQLYLLRNMRWSQQ